MTEHKVTSSQEYSSNWSDENMNSICNLPNYMAPIFDNIYLEHKFSSVLDVGCGNGHFTAYLKKYPVQIHGLDGSDYGVAEALKNGFDYCNKIDNFDYAELAISQKFDFVICKDVLEHVLYPLDLLKKIKAVSTEDGQIFVLVPNHFTLFHRLKFLFSGDIDAPAFFPHEPKWNYPHIRFFKHGDLQKMAEICGFKTTQDYSIDFFFFAPRGNGLFKKIRLSRVLAQCFPNLFCSAFAMVFTHDKKFVENKKQAEVIV